MEPRNKKATNECKGTRKKIANEKETFAAGDWERKWECEKEKKERGRESGRVREIKRIFREREGRKVDGKKDKEGEREKEKRDR